MKDYLLVGCGVYLGFLGARIREFTRLPKKGRARLIAKGLIFGVLFWPLSWAIATYISFNEVE